MAKKDKNKVTLVKQNENKYGVNPFLSNFRIKVIKAPHFGSFMKLDDGRTAPAWSWADTRSSINMYQIPKGETETINVNGIPTEINTNDKINKLPPNACKLLYWIFRQILYNDDIVIVNPDRYMDECEIKSIKTFRSAMKLLIKSGYVAKVDGAKNRYWINPKYVFHGNCAKQLPGNLEYPEGTPDKDKL